MFRAQAAKELGFKPDFFTLFAQPVERFDLESSMRLTVADGGCHVSLDGRDPFFDVIAHLVARARTIVGPESLWTYFSGKRAVGVYPQYSCLMAVGSGGSVERKRSASRTLAELMDEILSSTVGVSFANPSELSVKGFEASGVKLLLVYKGSDLVGYYPVQAFGAAEVTRLVMSFSVVVPRKAVAYCAIGRKVVVPDGALITLRVWNVFPAVRESFRVARRLQGEKEAGEVLRAHVSVVSRSWTSRVRRQYVAGL